MTIEKVNTTINTTTELHQAVQENTSYLFGMSISGKDTAEKIRQFVETIKPEELERTDVERLLKDVKVLEHSHVSWFTRVAEWVGSLFGGKCETYSAWESMKNAAKDLKEKLTSKDLKEKEAENPENKGFGKGVINQLKDGVNAGVNAMKSLISTDKKEEPVRVERKACPADNLVALRNDIVDRYSSVRCWTGGRNTGLNTDRTKEVLNKVLDESCKACPGCNINGIFQNMYSLCEDNKYNARFEDFQRQLCLWAKGEGTGVTLTEQQKKATGTLDQKVKDFMDDIFVKAQSKIE